MVQVKETFGHIFGFNPNLNLPRGAIRWRAPRKIRNTCDQNCECDTFYAATRAFDLDL